jgi:biotin carboxylase
MNILIVAFEAGRWGPARLVKSLHEAGFQVAALCPAENALAQTCYLDRLFPLDDVRSSRHVERCLAAAMQAWQPQLVIPADERVVACLHALLREKGTGRLDAQARATLVASLGDPRQWDAMLLKNRTLQLAQSIGVRVPEAGAAGSVDAAVLAAERIGFPVYVKSSFSWAGRGVSLCHDRDEVAAAMAAGRPRSRLPFRNQLRRMLHRDWYPNEAEIDVQQAIAGVPAMYCAVAVDGEMLAGFAGITRKAGPDHGPSSVVWLGEHAAMAEASAAMVAALGATGFLGFDFMIEDATGDAYLIECNPRPIQVGHLGSRIGADLCAALAARLRQEPSPPKAAVHAEEIALFPQEWQRDADSLAGNDRYLDVPWDDQPLLRAMVA